MGSPERRLVTYVDTETADQIRQSAERNRRSVAAEIRVALDRYLKASAEPAPVGVERNILFSKEGCA